MILEDEDDLLKIVASRAVQARASLLAQEEKYTEEQDYNNHESKSIKCSQRAALPPGENDTTTTTLLPEEDPEDRLKIVAVREGEASASFLAQEKVTTEEEVEHEDFKSKLMSKCSRENDRATLPGSVAAAAPMQTTTSAGSDDRLAVGAYAVAPAGTTPVRRNLPDGLAVSEGAYNAVPPAHRREDSSLVSDDEVDLESTGVDDEDVSEQLLPEANPIQDDTYIGNQTRVTGTASPVDMERSWQTQQNWKRQKQCFILLSVLAAAAIAAGIIGSVVVRNKQQDDTSHADIEDISDDTSTTAPYSKASSSPAPSNGALDQLATDLPKSTLENLQIFGTPQWKAWDWLMNHQNISHMEEWRKKQLFALTTFFYAFEGENWYQPVKERWLVVDGTGEEEDHECLWFSSGFGYFLSGGEYHEWDNQSKYYVPPCNDLGEFTSLSLSGLQLSGLEPSIPLEVALLTSLWRVEISASDLEVSLSTLLPSAVYYQMTALKALEVNTNRLSGTIPTQLGQSTNLEWLMLQANQLTGPVPTELVQLTALETLQLDRNKLTGSVPTELGLLKALDDLSLNENQLTGLVPSEIGSLTTLRWLYLHANQLTGQIPTEIGFLKALVSVRLFDNQLTGQTPTEIGLLTDLNWGLRLSDNQLKGTIPTQIGLMASLYWLDLASNFLSGTVPTELGLMTSLTGLHFQNNNLTGALPSQLNQSMGLRLDGNQFSGAVPLHLCSFLLCDCSTNVSLTSTCENLKVIPDYPGRFPPMTAAGSVETITLMLNIHTDKWPEETSWIWQQETNETDVWDTLEDSGGGLELPLFLFSRDLTAASSNSSYKLIVSDSYGDGFSDGPGWITLTASNETVLYSFWEEGSFIEITIVVSVGADGSLEIMPTNSSG